MKDGARLARKNGRKISEQEFPEIPPWTPEEIYRRASGRRRYNSLRRFHAQERRLQVGKMLLKLGYSYGVQARIARALGVSEATVSRDIKAVLKRAEWCPYCGTLRERL